MFCSFYRNSLLASSPLRFCSSVSIMVFTSCTIHHVLLVRLVPMVQFSSATTMFVILYSHFFCLNQMVFPLSVCITLWIFCIIVSNLVVVDTVWPVFFQNHPFNVVLILLPAVTMQSNCFVSTMIFGAYKFSNSISRSLRDSMMVICLISFRLDIWNCDNCIVFLLLDYVQRKNILYSTYLRAKSTWTSMIRLHFKTTSSNIGI